MIFQQFVRELIVVYTGVWVYVMGCSPRLVGVALWRCSVVVVWNTSNTASRHVITLGSVKSRLLTACEPGPDLALHILNYHQTKQPD